MPYHFRNDQYKDYHHLCTFFRNRLDATPSKLKKENLIKGADVNILIEFLAVVWQDLLLSFEESLNNLPFTVCVEYYIDIF